MEINELLENSKITDIRWARGYFFIPDWIIVYLERGSEKYSIEAEINFRILSNDKKIFCFEDRHVDNNYNEMDPTLYYSLRDNVDCSLLSKELENAKKIIINKTVQEIIVESYGDVNIILSDNTVLQCINDFNFGDKGDLCVFHLLKEGELIPKIILGSTRMIPKLTSLYKIYSSNNGTIIENNLYLLDSDTYD